MGSSFDEVAHRNSKLGSNVFSHETASLTCASCGSAGNRGGWSGAVQWAHSNKLGPSRTHRMRPRAAAGWRDGWMTGPTLPELGRSQKDAMPKSYSQRRRESRI